MTAELIETASTSQIRWRTIADALWIAHRGGEFAGMVAADGDQLFEATNGKGRVTGYFATPEAARASIR